MLIYDYLIHYNNFQQVDKTLTVQDHYINPPLNRQVINIIIIITIDRTNDCLQVKVNRDIQRNASKT